MNANAKAQKFQDYDESKPHEWPDVDESDLRGEVRALVATHGRVATERRYYDDRAILRVRSVKLTPDGEPAAARCWQRHGDYDYWAPREWVTFPDDAEPLEDAHGAVEEARCWLHELALALCGCPTMAEALRPSPWGAFTGEPEADNPLARESVPEPVEGVTWHGLCQECMRFVLQPDKPETACPECGYPWLVWKNGDKEPRGLREALRERVAKLERQNTDQDAGKQAAEVQPVSTVEAGPYTQTAGHQAPDGPAAASSPLAATQPSAPTQRAEEPCEALSPPLVSGAPPLAPPRTVCRECLGSGRDRHGIIARDCPDCGGRGYERPLTQPTPAVVALVAQAAANVEARGASAAKRRNHRWDREAGRCTRCGVAIGRRDGVACTGGA